MQTAICHPERVSALALIVPLAWKPPTEADSTPRVSDEEDALLLRLLGSDLLLDGAARGTRYTRSPCARNPSRAGGRGD